MMLGKTEDGRRRGQQRMRWLDGITDSIDMSLSTFTLQKWPILERTESRFEDHKLLSSKYICFESIPPYLINFRTFNFMKNAF